MRLVTALVFSEWYPLARIGAIYQAREKALCVPCLGIRVSDSFWPKADCQLGALRGDRMAASSRNSHSGESDQRHDRWWPLLAIKEESGPRYNENREPGLVPGFFVPANRSFDLWFAPDGGVEVVES